MSTFKQKFTVEERRKESSAIMKKYTDRIPIICERSYTCTTLPEMDRRKFLVPSVLTVGQFIFVVRERIKLKSEEALFIMWGDKYSHMVSSTSDISTIYNKFRSNEDGFLYCSYLSENTFG